MRAVGVLVLCHVKVPVVCAHRYRYRKEEEKETAWMDAASKRGIYSQQVHLICETGFREQ